MECSLLNSTKEESTEPLRLVCFLAQWQHDARKLKSRHTGLSHGTRGSCYDQEILPCNVRNPCDREGRHNLDGSGRNGPIRGGIIDLSACALLPAMCSLVRVRKRPSRLVNTFMLLVYHTKPTASSDVYPKFRPKVPKHKPYQHNRQPVTVFGQNPLRNLSVSNHDRRGAQGFRQHL
jgi:hypothetical protein